MTDSLDTSEREADEPRIVRLPVREMRDEPVPSREGKQSRARDYADILNHKYSSSVEKAIAAELLRQERMNADLVYALQRISAAAGFAMDDSADGKTSRTHVSCIKVIATAALSSVAKGQS